MNETPVGTPGRRPVKPSLFLPLGASVLVIAGLAEAARTDDMVATTLGVAGAIVAAGAWLLALRGSAKLDPLRGTRFLSIAAIALAVSGLLNPEESLIGLAGVIGLWLAVGGAAIEWRRGRSYGLGVKEGEGEGGGEE
ncbi:MAG: hypothetical protein V3U38_04990 [Gemmatimonadota bacterium]